MTKKETTTKITTARTKNLVSSARSHTADAAWPGHLQRLVERGVAAAHERQLHDHGIEERGEREGGDGDPHPAQAHQGEGEHGADRSGQQRPTTVEHRTGKFQRSASWNTVNPPMAANAPWQSEICPAKPVRTVMDRKIVRGSPTG
ncbi:MAG: hypothetical protein U0P45_15905 [Acidimicrobiales bacterium]